MNQSIERKSASLPPEETMFRAFVSRDREYDGVFYTAVKTTGIFCRPTCHARKPKRHNVEFFPTPNDAMLHGYRPCRICKPLSPTGEMPEWVSRIVELLQKEPATRIRDVDLRNRGVDPVRLRRWFKTNLGLTFQEYSRSLRVGTGLGAMADGETATGAAFDSGFESLSGFGDAVKRLVGASPSRAAAGPPVLLSPIPTPLGSMIAGVSDEKLVFLEFEDRRAIEKQIATLGRRFPGPVLAGRSSHHDTLESELLAYFAGRLKEFSTPVFAPGTPFQERVWSALRSIPYGETRSYSQQAQIAGRPDAVRAVARANGANRIAILIPCHRVIGADGQLTGYGGGLWRKKRLLEVERGQLTL